MCIKLKIITSVNDASLCQHTQNLSQVDRVCFDRRPTLAKPDKHLDIAVFAMGLKFATLECNEIKKIFDFTSSL